VTDTPAISPVKFEFDLDAPRSKVWRALAIPSLRDQWLPRSDLIDGQVIAVREEEVISYQMRDPTDPFLESTVTFSLIDRFDGGTRLRIVHELNDRRAREVIETAVNENGALTMLAA